MGECDFGAIILPTLEDDLSELAHQLLGVPLLIAKRWCKSKKLNISMVFKYFSKKKVPFTGTEHSHHFNAFCLCILARFFLVHETPRIEPGVLHVLKNLGSGSVTSQSVIKKKKKKKKKKREVKFYGSHLPPNYLPHPFLPHISLHLISPLWPGHSLPLFYFIFFYFLSYISTLISSLTSTSSPLPPPFPPSFSSKITKNFLRTYKHLHILF